MAHSEKPRRVGYGETVIVSELPADIPLPDEVPSENFTKIHHSIHEYWMRRLSGNAYKVFEVVLRKIIGWVDPKTGQSMKREIAITLDEFAEITGITDRDTLRIAIQEALVAGAIMVAARRLPGGTRIFRLRNERASYVFTTSEKRKKKGDPEKELVVDSPLPLVGKVPLSEVVNPQQPEVVNVQLQKSPQPTSGEAPANPKETPKEIISNKPMKETSDANASGASPHVLSEKGKKENEEDAATPPLEPTNQQEPTSTPANDQETGPTAELVKQESEEIARKRAAYEEWRAPIRALEEEFKYLEEAYKEATRESSKANLEKMYDPTAREREAAWDAERKRIKARQKEIDAKIYELEQRPLPE